MMWTKKNWKIPIEFPELVAKTLYYKSQKIRKFFVEFCDNSTIHGVRYFTERRLHWSERFWWIIAFLLSTWLCGSSIRTMWMQWHDNPVKIDFTEEEPPISSIPFPTVTICSSIKVKRNILDLPSLSKSRRLESLALSDFRVQALAHICENFPYIFDFNDNFTSEEIYDTITNLVPSYNETFPFGFFHDHAFVGSKYFAPVFTEHGLCFAFNSLNSNEMYTKEMVLKMMTVKTNPNSSQWNLENGYTDEPSETEYPLRVFYPNEYAGLSIFPQVSYSDPEYVCKLSGLTFSIGLSVPGETFSRKILEAPFFESTRIMIKPKMITTSEGLRDYEPKQRGCFYQSERQLRFFKMYSQANCEEECLANRTKSVCGCVAFSMPRDKNTKICGTAKIKCYLNIEHNLHIKDTSKNSENNSTNSFRNGCNCLPSCTTIKYNADVSHLKLDPIIMDRSVDDMLPSFRRSIIRISYSDSQVKTIKRMEAFTFTDFMAICGGLLGLFLGISLLSIVEFIYYFTLRLYWIIRRSRLENAVVPHKPIIECVSIDIPNN